MSGVKLREMKNELDTERKKVKKVRRALISSHPFVSCYDFHYYFYQLCHGVKFYLGSDSFDFVSLTVSLTVISL